MIGSSNTRGALPVLKSTHWNILYRGTLSSCNYGCGYCPFAKTKNTKAELAQDRQEVERFVAWADQRSHQSLGVLFTPWGEALIHHYYRRAMIELTQMPHVRRVAIQTNLSCNLSDFAAADPKKLAFWATFHPGESPLQRFLDRCQQLESLGLKYSVGVVGLKEHFEELEELRRRLLPTVYIWVNAYKREPNYYSDTDALRIRAVDPYFDLNRHYYPSQGKACGAGETSFTVDGEGNMRRCHFIKPTIGNIYETDFETALRPRACNTQTCGCHIGYVHRPELKLDDLFGTNILERIPATWPELDQRFA